MSIMYEYHIEMYESDSKNIYNYYGIVCANSYEKAMKCITEYYIGNGDELISVTISSWGDDIVGFDKKELLDNLNAECF